MNERIPVVFDGRLRPEWIDYALEQYVKRPEPSSHRLLLLEYLAGQVKGDESRKKVVRQLQRSVGHLSPIPGERLTQLYLEMSALAPEARGHLRLQLLEEATPFVRDCVSALRRLCAVSCDGAEVQHVYDRMVEKYGDRPTVYRRVRYVLQTLVLLGVAKHVGQRWFFTCSRQGG